MSWRMERGDCLSLMRQMDSSSVDYVISDPPYDAKTHANVMTNKKGTDGTIQLGFEALSTMAHVKEMLRVAKRWVLCFCALEQFGEYQMFSGDSWVRAGIWVRTNSMPQKTGDRPGQGAEGIAIMWAGGGKPSWNGGGLPGVWRGPRSSGDHHPTEKPEWLMEVLIRQFTDYGQTILDPYAGSGTTGVAAVRLGRNFVGYEMLDKHHQTAIVRLTATKEQMGLEYKPKKKGKQLKLIGGDHVKEEVKAEVEAELPDHRAGAEVDAGQVAVDSEEGQPQNWTARGHDGDRSELDRQGDGLSGIEDAEIPDRDREEGSPFDEEDPEEDGESPTEFGGDF